MQGHCKAMRSIQLIHQMSHVTHGLGNIKQSEGYTYTFDACSHAANISQVPSCCTATHTDLQRRATFRFLFQVTCAPTLVHETHKATGRFLSAIASKASARALFLVPSCRPCRHTSSTSFSVGQAPEIVCSHAKMVRECLRRL